MTDNKMTYTNTGGPKFSTDSNVPRLFGHDPALDEQITARYRGSIFSMEPTTAKKEASEATTTAPTSPPVTNFVRGY